MDIQFLSRESRLQQVQRVRSGTTLLYLLTEKIFDMLEYTLLQFIHSLILFKSIFTPLKQSIFADIEKTVGV